MEAERAPTDPECGLRKDESSIKGKSAFVMVLELAPVAGEDDGRGDD